MGFYHGGRTALHFFFTKLIELYKKTERVFLFMSLGTNLPFKSKRTGGLIMTHNSTYLGWPIIQIMLWLEIFDLFYQKPIKKQNSFFTTILLFNMLFHQRFRFISKSYIDMCGFHSYTRPIKGGQLTECSPIEGVLCYVFEYSIGLSWINPKFGWQAFFTHLSFSRTSPSSLFYFLWRYAQNKSRTK